MKIQFQKLKLWEVISLYKNMIDKTIKIYVKSNYGRDSIYIKDKEIAETIESLTGQKTVSQDHLIALRKLGFEFVAVPR